MLRMGPLPIREDGEELDGAADRQGEDRAVEAVAGFGEADVGLVGVAAAVEEDAAEALVGAEQIVDAGADGEAEHVLVLDERAEIAGRVEELPALVQSEQGRLAVLEEIRAPGPVAARHVVAEVDLELAGHVLVDRPALADQRIG